MSKKIRVGILFGGKSAEHEVSIQSAKHVVAALERKKYSPVLIAIDQVGQWYRVEESALKLSVIDQKSQRSIGMSPVVLLPAGRGKLIFIGNPKRQEKVDVVFPILHGTLGEDGTVQGLLRLAEVPLVGAGVLGSAVSMDKDVMKRLLRDAGLPIGRFITLRRGERTSYQAVSRKLGKIVFVKPANLGSSIGISKAKNAREYRAAIELAFRYDTKILIEEFVPGREIECAVLGNRDPQASIPGEIIPQHEFYSYEAKYLDPDGARLSIPAKLSARKTAEIQKLAIRTFQALECAGLGRVDFFLTLKGEIFVNEINTLPGFTEISMYPKLWAASGIGYTELIDRLIQLALERAADEGTIETLRIR